MADKAGAVEEGINDVCCVGAGPWCITLSHNVTIYGFIFAEANKLPCTYSGEFFVINHAVDVFLLAFSL